MYFSITLYSPKIPYVGTSQTGEHIQDPYLHCKHHVNNISKLLILFCFVIIQFFLQDLISILDLLQSSQGWTKSVLHLMNHSFQLKHKEKHLLINDITDNTINGSKGTLIAFHIGIVAHGIVWWHAVKRLKGLTTGGLCTFWYFVGTSWLLSPTKED